jgi:hypothetical protein
LENLSSGSPSHNHQEAKPLSLLFCALHAPSFQREDARQSHLPLVREKRPVTSVTSVTSVTFQNKKGLSHLEHWSLLSLLEHSKTKKGLFQLEHWSHLSLQFVNELPAMKFIA